VPTLLSGRLKRYYTVTALFLSFSAFGINSILYQRGIYPSETFTRVQKYGLTLLTTTDPELIKYLNNVVEQLKGNHVFSV
jgi:mitotic spindle assembly checkpoint protein MAD2